MRRGSHLIPALCVVVLALSGCASSFNEPLPSANVGDSPGEQRTELLRACLAADGWEVDVSWDGYVTASIPASQQSEYSADNRACVAAAQAKIPLPVIDASTLQALYDDELKNYKCIEGQGYELPTPPSLQSFIDTYETAPWSATGLLTPESYPSLFDGDGDGFKQLLTQCRPPSYFR